MPVPRDAAARNRAAEARATRDGRRCRLDGDVFLVASGSRPGVTYHLRAYGLGPHLVVVCDCPRGTRHSGVVGGGLGVMGCKHAALVARRLRRERLARFNPLLGTWDLTEAARQLAPVVPERRVPASLRPGRS